MHTTTTKLTIIAAALLFSTTAHAAGTAINETGETPDASAILDARSSTKGFLPPRMTAVQRGAIASPATGLQVYQTDGTAGLYVYNGTAWNLIGNATGTVSTANGGTGSTDGSITGSGTLTFTAGGTNQNVTLTPTGTGYTLLGGNVGIGTTTPVAKLHIAGADMNNALLFENTSANPGRNFILFKTQGTEQGYIGLGGGATNHMSVAAYGASNNLFLETNGIVKMTVLPSGNVGIGTTTPAYKLHIQDATSPALAIQYSTNSDYPYLSSNASNDLVIGSVGSGSHSVFKSNGNVGIGTTTPYTTLTVGSTDATARITAGGPNTHLTLASAGPNGDIYLNAGGVASGNYSTSTRLSVGANGNVGIGTTTPAELLQVGTESNGATARKTIKIGSGGYSAPAAFQTNSNGDKIILYNADGYDARIGIGGSTDMWFKSSSSGTEGQFKWYTGGNANLIMQLSSGSLSMAGGAYCNGTTWVNASDSRLKRDIQPMSKYGLSTVMQLKPVTYFYKADTTNHPEVGFIAQEMQKIVPEAVFGIEGNITKGETLGLSYGNLVPVLTKAIQEQQAEIEVLKSQNAALTLKADGFDQLKAEVENLKKVVYGNKTVKK